MSEPSVTEVAKKKYSKFKRTAKDKTIKFVIVLVFFLLGFFVGRFYVTHDLTLLKSKDNGSELTVSMLEKSLIPRSKLITQSYVYKDAIQNTDDKKILGIPVPFTELNTMFTYEGRISAGYDFSKIKKRVDQNNKIVYLRLPNLELISNEIYHNSFKFVNEKNNIFNLAKPSDMTELEGKLEKKMADEAMNDKEFVKNAEKTAKELLKTFVLAGDTSKEYKVKFE